MVKLLALHAGSALQVASLGHFIFTPGCLLNEASLEYLIFTLGCFSKCLFLISYIMSNSVVNWQVSPYYIQREQ